MMKKILALSLLCTISIGQQVQAMDIDPDDMKVEQDRHKKDIQQTTNFSRNLSPKEVEGIIDISQSVVYLEGCPHLYNITYVNKSAEMKESEGLFIKGLMIMYGKIPSKNKEVEALQFIKAAAAKGHNAANAYMYFVYKDALFGEPQDLVSANNVKRCVDKVSLEAKRFVPIRENDLKCLQIKDGRKLSILMSGDIQTPDSPKEKNLRTLVSSSKNPLPTLPEDLLSYIRKQGGQVPPSKTEPKTIPKGKDKREKR